MQKQLINGQENHQVLSLNHSFIFHGFSVFTTFLSYQGRPFFLVEHLSRLKKHAQEIGLNYPGDEVFLSDLKILLPLDRFLRIRLSIGPDMRITEATSYIPSPKDCYTQGVKVICTKIQVHPQFASIKTGNYLPYLIAKKEAEKANCFEGLLIDANHHVVDGSRSSPMLYQNNVLTICQGGLDGITRQMVVKKAIEFGIQIKYEYVKAEEMNGQLVLAGSGIGLISVGIPCDQMLMNLIDFFSPYGKMS